MNYSSSGAEIRVEHGDGVENAPWLVIIISAFYLTKPLVRKLKDRSVLMEKTLRAVI